MEKIALITGGARRVGREICLHLAQQGWKIAVHYNNSEREAKSLKAEIDNISRCIVIQKNFKNLSGFSSFLKKIEHDIGTPNLLINNASAFVNDKFVAVTEEKLESHFHVNCFAPLLLAQEFIKLNPSRETNIINIIDSSIDTYSNKFFSYTLSKKSLLEITKNLAINLAPRCRVNAISPSFVMKADGQSEASFEQSISSSPLKIATKVMDICNVIDTILAVKSMTGSNITI